MKLGLFDHMQKHDNPSLSYVELYKNHLDVLQFADQAGMDFYFVAEHHFDMGFSECPSPGSFLGAASQRSKRIRLGPLVYVLPLWNPIRVAEEAALLDNLTEGRLECGFGAGIGPFTFAAYNVPWEQKREMTLEALQIIKGIWTHKSFSFEGCYFKCKDIESSIPLVQKPHPPLWMPTRSKDSIEEAASSGISTIQWVPSGMKAVRKAFDEYREVYQRTKPMGRKPHMGLMREIYVAGSDRRARAEGEFHWKNFWERRGGGRTYGAHGATGLATILDGTRRQELMNMEHSIAEGSFICGSPETVAQQIKKIAGEAGADTFLGEFTFGELSQQQALNSLRLFTEQVMPELRKFEIDALNFPKAETVRSVV
jgi:alkanesulfonate monooxygenase SsuD/methylene tetrahydromethanopterin reductase-like flavin-dependent oxidoreductase (luciferase family)